MGPLVVALSGGVDSVFLMRVAHDILPGQVSAFFADSLVQPEGTKAVVVRLAGNMGVPVRIFKFDLLALAEFRENSGQRCYYCKTRIFTAFQKICQQQKTILVDGTNLDDLDDIRPGMRACQELGVKSPLFEAGLTKTDIRSLSRDLGLVTWNKPSESCLATRITEGQIITFDALSVVAKGEDYLHCLGFVGCRLRLCDKSGTIELAAEDIVRFVGTDKWTEASAFLYSLGLKKVFLDLSEREGILS